MGLQNNLSDVSSESILVFMVVLLGKTVSYLHSLLRTIGVLGYHHYHSSIYDVVGSGLGNLIVLCDQLNLNRASSYPNRYLNTDCMVCLNQLGHGDTVRRLDCHHVFHKDCLDAWLDHLNFNCPLCRAPLASNDRVLFTQRRVAQDLVTWFRFSDRICEWWGRCT